jgi:hypothetical protein
MLQKVGTVSVVRVGFPPEPVWRCGQVPFAGRPASSPPVGMHCGVTQGVFQNLPEPVAEYW